jgi:hypothetical protein
MTYARFYLVLYNIYWIIIGQLLESDGVHAPKQLTNAFRGARIVVPVPGKLGATMYGEFPITPPPASETTHDSVTSRRTDQLEPE